MCRGTIILMKINKAITLLIIVATFLVILVVLSTVTYKAKVIINGNEFIVEVAQTKLFQERGLSGHAPLGLNEGMFFMFEKPDKYGFWMKEMNFPIDIMWISEDFKIVHIEKGVKPESYPKVYYPNEESMYVLEVSSGRVGALNFKIGDSVRFERKISKNT